MCKIWALIAALSVLLTMGGSLFGRCHAEESLFMDGNSHYPLVYAQEDVFRYLDFDSCTIISKDESGFELSVKYLFRPDVQRYTALKEEERVCRFRKNEESDWKLQVWDDHYDKGWKTFIDPHDEDAIEQILDEKGRVSFGLYNYYMFKCVYQHLFDEPYEDDFDDEELRRTVINLPRDGEKWEIHHYLWDDENYRCVRSHPSDGAWYVDESSVYVEMESPSQCILRILVYQTPQYHNNDMMADSISLYRYLYDKDEEKMYEWHWPSQKWMYSRPQPQGWIDYRVRNIGRYTYALVYGESFYKTDSK